MDYKERSERFNLDGVEVIKRAKSEVQAQKTVNMAVLNCLNSLEDFWNTNIFYSKLGEWARYLNTYLIFFCVLFLHRQIQQAKLNQLKI